MDRSSSSACYALIAAGLALLIALATLVGACSSPPQATATPTRTPRPTEAVAATQPPAATVPPTVAPAPTSTPLPTPTAVPTATAAPTATPTSGVSLIVPAREPGVSPFTGLRPADPAVLQRRPLAIKVANMERVRPQSGLSKADIVVESRVEYALTRFTAIYQSQNAERVGSIRSARLIDVELPAIFDAILCYSGGVQPVLDKLHNSDSGDHMLTEGPGFFRATDVTTGFWEDTLFASTTALWNVATARGWNKPPVSSAGWVFSEAAPTGGATATRVEFPYPEGIVSWTYDPASGRWLRFVRGAPHVDAVDGKQLSAADVVVLGANHVITLIVENGTERVGDPCINCSVEIQLWGEGPAKILRDGKVYEGKWVRADRHAPFRFVNAAGQDLPLKPGNAWWQIAPLDLKVTITP